MRFLRLATITSQMPVIFLINPLGIAKYIQANTED